jgi:hypothetical protein
MTRLDTMTTDGEYSRLLALMRAADVEAEDDAQVPVRDVVDPGVSAAGCGGINGSSSAHRRSSTSRRAGEEARVDMTRGRPKGYQPGGAPEARRARICNVV